jgi:mRNA interferase RelE/StbE
VSYQVNWEIQALDQTAGFLRDDPVGVAVLWDTVGQLADEPRPPE